MAARACQDIKHDFDDDALSTHCMQARQARQARATMSSHSRETNIKTHRYSYDAPVRLGNFKTGRQQAKISSVCEPIKRAATRASMASSRLAGGTVCRMLITSASVAVLMQSISVACDNSRGLQAVGSAGIQTLSSALLGKSSQLSQAKTASQRQRLLESLAQSVERQHLGLGPTPGHERPSSFEASQSVHKLSARPPSDYPGGQTSSTMKMKAEDSMRSVLMMHEMAARAPPLPQPQVVNQQKEKHISLDRWATLNNTLFKQVASLIQPLAGFDKASNSEVLGANHSNSTGTRAKLHQFVARSNNSPITLINIGLSQLSKRVASPATGVQRKTVTEAPQTSFLAKPIFAQLSGLAQQFSPTPQSVSFELNSKCTSSDACTVQPALPEEVAAASSELVATNPPADHQKASGSAKEKLASTGSAGSWLKNSANQIAQSYLHDSFRGLLTMSQLPILSANPISTAPSIHECTTGRCKAGQSQESGRPTSGSTSTTSSLNRLQNKRRRALDELYRYAYLVGSGVRRKRDPLKALSSASSPSALSSLTNRRRGVFGGQKSNNEQQLANNEITNLANAALKLIRASGPSSKRAKPRGVMWEMATDPSLAVTLFHLLERASFALPLGKFEN